MTRVRFQTRIEHPVHRGVSHQEIGHGRGILLVPIHSHREGLNAANHQPAVKGRGAAPHGVEQELNLFRQLVSGGYHRPTYHIAVPIEILGGRVDHQVNPILNRVQKIRCRKGIVYHRHLKVYDIQQRIGGSL